MKIKKEIFAFTSNYASRKVFILILLCLGIFIFYIGGISATQIEYLPKKRDHIRIFRNFGLDHEIIKNNYDLSFNSGVIKSDPEHISLSYALNTEMIVPSEESSQFKVWWCTYKLNKAIEQCKIPEDWLCIDASSCDIPEDIFLHFKNDTIITINLGVLNLYDGIRTGTAKGWDPDNFIDSNQDGFIDIDIDKDGNISDSEWEYRPNKNASARIMQDARVPSFYWGKYWEYLTGETVSHHSNFAMNIGSPDYLEFMSKKYIPGIFKNDVNVDGIYFDDATHAYSEIWDSWGKINGFVEYMNEGDYLIDNITLLQAIKENIPSDKIIIGNGWHSSTGLIDGSQRETWLDISQPFEEFINAVDSVRFELSQRLINLVQFVPLYHKDYAQNGIHAPVTRERDQIYALASYYLAAGDRSYFGYGVQPYRDDGNLLFKAINFDVGIPKGDYYIFSSKHGQNNILSNANFETADNNNNPDKWIVAEPVEIDTSIKYEGRSSVKINSTTIVNNSNKQPITLKPYTTYTLSAYVKTENVAGTYLFSGANFYPYDFDDSIPKLTGCGSSLSGTHDWTLRYCTFTTGADVDGTVNFRIKYGTGTAWFDKVDLSEGIPRIVLARKYSKALVLIRPRADDNTDYEDPVVYKLHKTYRQLLVDGSFGEPSKYVTLNSAQATILTCTYWNGNEYIAGATCQNLPPSAPTLVSPGDNQAGLDSEITFRWNQSVDSDRDAVTYTLSYCTKQDFTDCDAISVASQPDKHIYFASTGNLFEFMFLGVILTGGIKVKKKFVSLVMVLIISGGMLLSCGGGSIGNGNNNANAMSTMSYTISGLSPGTTYYWKVSANDGNDSTAGSEIRSFSTK